MATNLILSGGVAHDFPATSEVLADLLSEVGIQSEITEDIAGALGAGPDVQLITVNALRCCMDGGWSAEEGGSSFELPPDARAGLLRHLDRGGGVLAMHAAAICFDDWDRWRQMLGASWAWGVSHHPPLGPAEVKVHGGHPIVEGLGDFELIDEVYSDLDVLPDVVPLASALGQPLVWARTAGRGRLVYDALGHDSRSYESPAHRTLVKGAARWLTRAG
ncbi:hypothetical protein GCM10022226_34070 [Sphaerisporangium flaviroseum]|uniref:ThuA-like domain-containing protein n=1 Tax=Sphaerisporangium flaviroseum TaxID=509199 RepID=A0ABP7I5J2_9ACTN